MYLLSIKYHIFTGILFSYFFYILERMKKIIVIGLAAVLLGCSSSQDAAKIQAVTQMIESSNYVFVADMALPMGGKSIFLTSTYTLEVTKDTLVSYLPYFGRAYVAPLDPTDGGIQFESTQFDYQVKKKSGGWDIELRPTDVKRRYRMFLDVSETGSAFLNVTSEDRQSISFNGYIDKIKVEN